MTESNSSDVNKTGDSVDINKQDVNSSGREALRDELHTFAMNYKVESFRERNKDLNYIMARIAAEVLARRVTAYQDANYIRKSHSGNFNDVTQAIETVIKRLQSQQKDTEASL